MNAARIARRSLAPRYPRLWIAIGLLLLVPPVAMRFTREVNWTPADFAAAAMLLGGGAALIELAARLLPRAHDRVIAVLGIAAAVALVWIDGAVGIF